MSRLKQVVLPAPLGRSAHGCGHVVPCRSTSHHRKKAVELLGQATRFDDQIVSHIPLRPAFLIMRHQTCQVRYIEYLSAATPQLSRREWRATLSRVFAALEQSDAIILRHFRKAKIQHKADGSEVTVADRGAERLLRRHLRAAWPQDAVLGEEYGGELRPAWPLLAGGPD